MGIPCLGLPTLTYGGQVYSTLQVLSQCWLKENLNYGDMINGDIEMSNNGIVEKYCYNNEPDSCVSLGGLYLWDEMMQYVTAQGSQGICPPGWHIPTDDEWKILEGGVDSQYGIGDPEWDNSQYYRGFDAGNILKANFGWQDGGNGVDGVGFSAFPGGVHWYDGMNYFHTAGSYGNWWSSAEYSNFSAWTHNLGYDKDGVHRMPSGKDFGYSVRCLRDN
jgi:uncharacterized protein (TIGR02145 family)